MKLITEWKSAWKMISVQIMTLATALQGAWLAMPADTRAMMHPEVLQWVTVALLVVGIVGRLVDQGLGTSDAE